LPGVGLSTAVEGELLPDFRAILDDRSQHPVLVKCMLDAIAHGQALPALGDLLLEMVRDESRFLMYRLVDTTDPSDLPILLDALTVSELPSIHLDPVDRLRDFTNATLTSP